jgi:hypothetical protein
MLNDITAKQAIDDQQRDENIAKERSAGATRYNAAMKFIESRQKPGSKNEAANAVYAALRKSREERERKLAKLRQDGEKLARPFLISFQNS